MIGCGLGTLDLRTYWLRSGTGGHSVFSMYCAISGQEGEGGIDDFRMYFVISGYGGQSGHLPRALGWSLHGEFVPQMEQTGVDGVDGTV